MHKSRQSFVKIDKTMPALFSNGNIKHNCGLLL